MAEYIFKRYEKKYILNLSQYEEILKVLEYNTVPDKYGETDVCNIYFDTLDYRIIRASIEKPVYKEKLRIRSYGTPDDNSPCFLELKKKYKGVVYKRRIKAQYKDGFDFISDRRDIIPPSQIKSEIEYFKSFYNPIIESCNIFYKRRAFLDRNNPTIRFTFDRDLLYRNYDLDLKEGIYGDRIIPEDKIIMEIKTPGGMPLWTAETLTRLSVFPTPFSKYGTAFKAFTQNKPIGVLNYDR